MRTVNVYEVKSKVRTTEQSMIEFFERKDPDMRAYTGVHGPEGGERNVVRYAEPVETIVVDGERHYIAISPELRAMFEAPIQARARDEIARQVRRYEELAGIQAAQATRIDRFEGASLFQRLLRAWKGRV